jgi:hypothetical protein
VNQESKGQSKKKFRVGRKIIALLLAIAERLDRLEGCRIPQMLPHELPRREAARYIGVGVDTLERLQKLGLLRYRNASPPGSGKPRYRYPVADLDRLIQHGYRRDLPQGKQTPHQARKRTRPQSYEHLDLD